MADDIFGSIAETPPDREGDEEEEEISEHLASASQAEGSAPNDSDLETLLKRLLPYCDNEDIQRIAPFIMMGRVFPDNFSTKIYLLVCNLAEKHNDDPDFDVWETETIIEGICQMGLEGKTRVEVLIGAGNTKEQAEQESPRVGGF